MWETEFTSAQDGELRAECDYLFHEINETLHIARTFRYWVRGARMPLADEAT